MEAAFDTGRVPPQSTEAEQATLGSMLIDSDAITTALDILSPGDFYKEAHRVIFETIVSMYKKARQLTSSLLQRNCAGAISLIS